MTTRLRHKYLYLINHPRAFWIASGGSFVTFNFWSCTNYDSETPSNHRVRLFDSLRYIGNNGLYCHGCGHVWHESQHPKRWPMTISGNHTYSEDPILTLYLKTGLLTKMRVEQANSLSQLGKVQQGCNTAATCILSSLSMYIDHCQGPWRPGRAG
jgi:hypothetical protein